MAQAVPLVLGTIGAILGAPFGLQGVGFAAGAALGSLIVGGQGQTVRGPLPPELTNIDSAEGRVIPIFYGRLRTASNILALHSRTEQQIKTKKGVKTVRFFRRVKMGCGIGEGELDLKGMIVNGRFLIDTSANIIDSKAPAYTFYSGSANQAYDPVLDTIQTDPTPAYSELSYIVFHDWNLESYGNNIPAILFEIERNEPDIYIYSTDYTIEFYDRIVVSGGQTTNANLFADDLTSTITFDNVVGKLVTSSAKRGPQYPFDPSEHKLIYYEIATTANSEITSITKTSGFTFHSHDSNFTTITNYKAAYFNPYSNPPRGYAINFATGESSDLPNTYTGTTNGQDHYPPQDYFVIETSMSANPSNQLDQLLADKKFLIWAKTFSEDYLSNLYTGNYLDMAPSRFIVVYENGYYWTDYGSFYGSLRPIAGCPGPRNPMYVNEINEYHFFELSPVSASPYAAKFYLIKSEVKPHPSPVSGNPIVTYVSTRTVASYSDMIYLMYNDEMPEESENYYDMGVDISGNCIISWRQDKASIPSRCGLMRVNAITGSALNYYNGYDLAREFWGLTSATADYINFSGIASIPGTLYNQFRMGRTEFLMVPVSDLKDELPIVRIKSDFSSWEYVTTGYNYPFPNDPSVVGKPSPFVLYPHHDVILGQDIEGLGFTIISPPNEIKTTVSGHTVGWIIHDLITRVTKIKANDPNTFTNLFDKFDFSEVQNIPCKGFAITEQTTFVEAVTQLGIAYSFIDVESDGIIKFRKIDVSSSPVATITEEDLVGNRIEYTIVKDSSVPSKVTLSYIDEQSYEEGVAIAEIPGIPNDNERRLSVPIVLSYEEAYRAAWINLFFSLRQKHRYKFSILASKGIAIEPADVLKLNVSLANGVKYDTEVFVTKVILNGLKLDIEAIEWNNDIAGSIDVEVVTSAIIDYTPPPVETSNLYAQLLSLPCIDDDWNNTNTEIRAYTWKITGVDSDMEGTLTIGNLNNIIDNGIEQGNVTKISSIPANINPNLVTAGEIEIEFPNTNAFAGINPAPGNLEARNIRNGPFLVIGNSAKGWGVHLYEVASAAGSARMSFKNLLLFTGNSFDFVEDRIGNPTIDIGDIAFVLNDPSSDLVNLNIGSEGTYTYTFTPANVTNSATSNTISAEFHHLVPPGVSDIEISLLDSTKRRVTWRRTNRCDWLWRNLTDLPLDDTVELYNVNIYDSSNNLESSFSTSETSATVTINIPGDSKTIEIIRETTNPTSKRIAKRKIVT